MPRFLRFSILLLILVAASPLAAAADRPNFVWILSEDNSKHFMKLFDEHGAETPNIARLAEHGLIFNHAFSNAPVCSVARTTLITSVYAPRLGTQYHRKYKTVTMPPGWKMFPAYLHEAGYYTTNNSKKDYNAEETPDTWNESSKKATWRNRPAGSPFFHMQTFTDSHESSLHFTRKQMETQKTDTDPATVFIPPYHPKTPTFRYTYARYHDRMKVNDTKVASVVKKLEDDGLLEDTFVFYFGDHGGVLPRGKGYVYETGLHIPLVVRVPDKFRNLVAFPNGTRVDGFVSFIDFGPTLLHLAGIDVPDYMDGAPFLGPDVTLDKLNERNETFGYADRFDEKYEMVRTLRQGKWKYHRNFQGYLPDGLQNNYRYRMLAYQEWRELFHAGKLNAVQRAFFESKPAESLYDLENDPYETKNLAAEPAHRERLLAMRANLHKRMTAIYDLSLMPESMMIDQMNGLGEDFRAMNKLGAKLGFLTQPHASADLACLPFDEARPKLANVLKSRNLESVNGLDYTSLNAYWALNACCIFGKTARPLADAARNKLDNRDPLVRLQSAVFLAILKEEQPQPIIKALLKESKDPVFNAIALNQVVYLRDTLGYKFDLKPDDIPAKNDGVNRRLEYLVPKE